MGVGSIFGACGGDDGGQGGSVPTAGDPDVSSTVDVTGVDIDFSVTEFTAKAGTVKFMYRNEGQIRHTLVIEEIPGFDRLEVSRKGDTDQGTVKLAPGTYTIFCDVPGHRSAGMVAKVVVS
jgi:plastocyanin